ncbi:poly [ADP-ribose] polymerase 14-like isoform X2, partial [Paramuricea clavata]
MDEYEALIIEVTGINQSTTKDTLENYFSYSRRGGDITNIDYIKGSGNASLTFANAEGAKKALETRSHLLEESALTTQRKKAENSENDKVEGIPTKTSENDTEGKSDLDVKDITHDTKSSDNLNAIVTFYSPVDFDKMKEGFKSKPTLEGKYISIKTVPPCKTILVKNLPSTATYDSVWLRFESKRAGGADVEGVHLDPEKRTALVEFKDPNVIDKVLSVKQTLDNTTLSVERYHPILGSLADLQTTEQEISEPTRHEVPTAT